MSTEDDEAASALGRAMARRRNAKMTPLQRQNVASGAAKARWAASTPEQRAEQARRMAAGRKRR